MKNGFFELKKAISNEAKILGDISSLFNGLKKVESTEERRMILSHINSLKNLLGKTSENVLKNVEDISLPNPLLIAQKNINLPVQKNKEPSLKTDDKKQDDSPNKINFLESLREKKIPENLKLGDLEKQILKRLKKKEEKVAGKKEKKASEYVGVSNRIFSDFSMKLLEKKRFENLKRDLVKANLQFLPKSYISVVLFSTLLSVIASFFVFLFFLFFNFGPALPIITLSTENISTRFFKVFWVLFVFPLVTFLFMYFYPSMEKKSIGDKINQELPFAAIHMSSISSSMIDPSKIFSIIVSTHEYPNLEKEFTKLINEINVLGYDLVTALRNRAFNSPSKKLADLLNGLATTITSGGDLPEFFDKRAQTLLFEYRIEREKQTKAAETFMNIYISVVIFAPMIFMILLMMMKISGLGIQLSASMITLIMVLGVSMINVAFLVYLHLKQPSG